MSGSLRKNVCAATRHLKDTAGYPARAEEGAREVSHFSQGITSLFLSAQHPIFSCGLHAEEEFRGISKNILIPSVSLLKICLLLDWPENMHLLSMVHSLVGFRQISFPAKLSFNAPCFMQFSKDGLKGRVVISFFMSLSFKDNFDC